MDIYKLSIDELHAGYDSGALTVRKVALACMKRVAEMDKGENGLNAVLELNPELLFLADALDLKRARGEKLGPLFGVPVLLKDNINTGDKLTTTAGSLALKNNFAPKDAGVAKKLRAADALILGKANMTEFANFMSDGMSNGYSSRGGQVVSFHNRESDPSGSSTGSAVGVAAGYCPVSVGTETGGSIISPAMEAGLVGIKPTIGLISRAGIVPISLSQDTAGPMARTVRDAALLLAALAGEDEKDPATWGRAVQAEEWMNPSPRGLRGLRLGICLTNKGEVQEQDNRCADAMLERLKEAGAQLIELPDIPHAKGHFPIMLHEFKRAMNAYLSALGESAPVKTLEEIIAFNQRHAKTALKYGQRLLLDAEHTTSGTLTEPRYIEAMLEREATREKMDALFDEHRLDAVFFYGYTNIAPFCGYPCMTVRIGTKSNGVPVGSYFVARHFEEKTLFRIGYEVERLCIG